MSTTLVAKTAMRGDANRCAIVWFASGVVVVRGGESLSGVRGVVAGVVRKTGEEV